MSAGESQLLARLDALRRTLRVRLIAYGLVAVAAGGVFAFLTIVSLDWLLRLPPVLRMIIGVIFLLGFVGAALHWVLQPWRARLGLRDIAGSIERYFGRTDDRLSSTVDFLQSRQRTGHVVGSEAMLAKVISGTDQLIADMTFEEALSARALVVHTTWLAGGVAVLMAIAWVAPDWPRIGLHRYVAPLSELDWPHGVEVDPLTRELKVAFGESVTVRMAVRNGWHSDLRGVVHLRDPEGHMTSQAMQNEPPDAAGRVPYACTIDAVASELSYWFEAGDDSTANLPGRIQVVRRPEIASVSMTVLPPAYATSAAPRELDLSAGEVHAVLGSTLAVTIRSSKPLQASAATESSAALTASPPNLLRFSDEAQVALTLDATDAQLLTAQFPVQSDAAFRIHLTDRDGFTNRGGGEFRITALPDTPPTVTIAEPSPLTEVTPAGGVTLVAKIEDDFGLTDVELIGHKISGVGGDSAAAENDGAFRIPLLPALQLRPTAERVVGVVEYLWQVRELGATAGDVFAFQARALDNRSDAGSQGQEGLSPVMRLKLISPAELENRLRDEFALLETRLRQTLDDQEAVKSDTDRVHDAVSSEPDAAFPPEQVEQTGTLATRQARLGRGLRELARQFERLGRRMDSTGKASDDAGSQAARQIRAATAALTAIADGPAAEAAARLEETRTADEPAGQHESLTRARTAEQAVAENLRELVRNLGAWGDFREVVNKAREVFDRQQTLREQTAQLGKQTLGQSVEQLTPQQAAELAAQTRKQRQLAEQTGRLIEQMQKLAETRREQDPASSEALDAAARTAAAADISQSMREAAAKLETNRTAAAVTDQRAAEAALAKMLAGLQERPARELAELKKKLEQAEGAVERLLGQQRDLLNDNQDAQQKGAPAEAFEDLADRQKQVRRNTSALAGELADQPRTAEAAPVLQKAVPPMGRAENKLDDGDGPAAAPGQKQAVAALEDALAVVRKLAKDVKTEATRASLAALRTELETIRNRQQELNEQTAEIIERVTPADGKSAPALSRNDARRASQLAREQGELREQADGLRQKLVENVVYEWIMQRVVTGMADARVSLEGRRLDAALAERHGEVVANLQRLISAIAATEAMPTEEFAEGAGSEGGGGQGQPPSKPVPTVAELIVLRAMQEDLNTRTLRMAEGFDPQDATEEQLNALQGLGDDQRQVKELTATVTQRARQGPGGG